MFTVRNSLKLQAELALNFLCFLTFRSYRIIHLNPLKEECDLDSMGFVYRVAAMFQVKSNNASKKTMT